MTLQPDAPQEPSVSISLLGRFEVRAGDAVVIDGAWPRSKARALFKLLALAERRSVRRDELVGILWPGLDAAAASNNFHKNLHYLRTAFAAHGLSRLIVVTDETLALDDDARLDVDAFAELARRASTIRIDAAIYEEALGLYAGDLLIDDLDVHRLERFRGQLAESRAVLLLELCQLYLLRGAYQHAIENLHELVRADPAHEEAHRLLMRAYAATGRRRRALEQYEECRTLLREEVDVAPSPETEALARALREGHTPIRAAVAPTEGAFVGRERELGELQSSFRDAAAGRGRACLIGAEPGMGKTRLAEEFAVYAQLQGARVLWGRCYEVEGTPAFWPWIQVLESAQGSTAEEPLAPQADDSAPAVTNLFDLARGARQSASDGSGHGRQARFRLFGGVASFLRQIARQQAVVVVLDDLQGADGPSLLLLQFLAGELRGAGVLLLGTYRDTEVTADLQRTLAELAREQHCGRLTLSPLSLADVARLVEREGRGAAIPNLSDELYRRSEGNPFFVREFLRHLDDESGETGLLTNLPPTLRDVIHARLERLPAATRGLLATASVIGRDFELDVLWRASGYSRSICVEAMSAALQERVVDDTEGAQRYRFAHALFVEALYEAQPLIERAGVHQRVGEALEALRASRIDRHLAELASHFWAAARGGGDPGKAIVASRRAGDQAMELLAYEEGARHYDTAIAALDLQDDADDLQRCELLLALADAMNGAGDHQRCNDAAARAAELARKLGAREQQSRATLLTGPRTPYGQDGTWAPADLARLDDAIAAWGDDESELHATLLARRSTALSVLNRTEEAVAYAHRALDMNRRVAPQACAEVLHYAHGALFLGERLDERLGIAQELIDTARSTGDMEMEAHGHVWLFADLLAAGRIKEADVVNERLMHLAESLQQPFFFWYAWLQRSATEALRGNFDEAERCARAGTVAAKDSLPPGAAQLSEQAVSRLAVRLLRGDLDGLADMLMPVAEAFDAASGSATIHALPMIVSAEAGELADAERKARLLMDRTYLGRRDYMWLFGVAALVDTCAVLEEPCWAGDIYEALLPYAAQCVVLAEGGAWRGSAAHYLGILAAMMHRNHDAERHFAAALNMHELAEAPPFIARTQYEWARMLYASDLPEDAARAVKFTEGALATARELGMQRLVRRAGDLLDALSAETPG